MSTSNRPVTDPTPGYTGFVEAPTTGDIFAQQIVDATLLLRHAVERGKSVSDVSAQAIVDAQGLLKGGTPPKPEVWVAFAKAYRELAETMGDVRADTLRATGDEYGVKSKFPLVRGTVSVAKRWNRTLWIFAITFGALVVAAENFHSVLQSFFAADENTSDRVFRFHIYDAVVQTLVPFMYGGLGAATQLLRSAHVHLYGRTFDPNYIPEYFGRLLLGVIAGGTVELLISNITTDGTLVTFSGAALAFIAGYSNDFLFKAVERVTEALLPKVGVESLRRATPPAISGTSLPALIAQLEAAKTPEGKAAVQALINKVKERL
jgi:hypothetical protein